MSADLYVSEGVHWQDKCQASGCRNEPVVVVRSWKNGLWRWPLCLAHRWHVEQREVDRAGSR